MATEEPPPPFLPLHAGLHAKANTNSLYSIPCQSNKLHTIKSVLQVQCINGCCVLNRQTFIWNANEFCQQFKEHKTAATFASAYTTLSAEWRAKSLTQDDTVTKQPEQPPPTKKPRLDTTSQASLKDENDMSKWLDTLDFEIENQKVGKSHYHVDTLVTSRLHSRNALPCLSFLHKYQHL